MKRRDFFKRLAGVVAGAVVAPYVVRKYEPIRLMRYRTYVTAQDNILTQPLGAKPYIDKLKCPLCRAEFREQMGVPQPDPNYENFDVFNICDKHDTFLSDLAAELGRQAGLHAPHA